MAAISLPVLDNRTTGLIVYDGPSLIDGERIVAIATGLRRARNVKLGDMISVWIMRADISPIEALEEGEDRSICGSCKHRHFRSCYVNIAQGPRAVWNAYKNGVYAKATPAALELFRGRAIRFGAYGDPAAVPVSIWKSMASVAVSWTGYTHRWKQADPELRSICMASCDTEGEAEEARRRGWRPFRVRLGTEEVPFQPDGKPLYFVCPASKEGGYRMTCDRCRACKGGEYNGKPTPTIVAHGPSWKMIYFERGMKALRNKKSIRRANACTIH